jgi:hypothetical protein
MDAISSPVSKRYFAVVLSALALWGFAVSSGAAPPDERSTATLTGTRRVTTPPPETLNQPPATTAALGPRAEGPRGVYMLGPLVSVQVNVNALGNNIIGDAANEPTLAINPLDPSRMAIAWRQFDSITSDFRQAGHAYSLDGGQTWTFPGVLDPGQFRSDPVLGSDAAGNFYLSSLSSVTNAEVFRSLDSGVNWLAPVSAFGGDKQWLTVDDRPSGMGAGHIYQNWNVQFSCCTGKDLTRSTNGAVSFQPPRAIPLPSMKWGTNDVASDGTLYLAGSTLNQDGHLVTRSSNANNPAVAPIFDFVNPVNLGGLTGGFGGPTDPNPVGLLGQVWIAVDPGNVNRVYILASVVPPAGNPVDVMFIRSVNKAVSWSAPVRVNDDPASGALHWFGTLSVAPNGRIDVVWNDSRHSGIGNVSELYYSSSVDTGFTWSPNVPLSPMWDSHLGWPVQQKIGDYYHMISDNGGASLAYAATFNGEQDVYFLRIPADCNHNGGPDDQDVLSGAPDCNHNLIPDVCEPQADCNGNGTQDICDIFSGLSADCNLDIIPDECENPTDCNDNGQTDFCDIAAGAPDCNHNEVPDACDIGSGSSPDANGDQIPDECEGACCQCSGSCSLTTSSACTSASGFFNGTGSSCAGAICGVPNDNCADGITLPGDPVVTVPFDSRCATTDGPPTVDCDAPAEPFGADLWYDYVAPCDGLIRVSLCGATNFDSMLAVYGGTSSACDCQQVLSTQLACGDDNCGAAGGPSEVFLNVTAGRCYAIRVGGWQGSAGGGELSLTYLTVCNLVKFTQPPDATGEDVASNIDRTDMSPNAVVADDFVSDGRPITSVRWWGSNFGEGFPALFNVANDTLDVFESTATITPTCPADAFVAQPASTPGQPWNLLTSDSTIGWIVWEKFSGAAAAFTHAKWWGLEAYYDGMQWLACNEPSPSFHITFYGPGEFPGLPVCVYTLVPSRVDTGHEFAPFGHLYQYEVDLSPPCALTSGWVSIQGYNGDPNCWFLWGASQSGDGSTLQSDGATVYNQYLDRGICLSGPVCGNAIVELGEECDPPDGVTCDGNCRRIFNAPIDGWLISFHEPLEMGLPPAPPLGLYFCDAAMVDILPTALSACDTHPVRQYDVDLVNCCLIHANLDSRSGLVPAQRTGFQEQSCFTYDIDIQAVVGSRFVDSGGVCVELPTGHAAVGDVWGWHSTGVERGLRPAVQTVVSMPGPNWLYGPWAPVDPVCSTPNMAFELLTTTSGAASDCNANGVPDVCEALPDCQPNGVPDECDIARGHSQDVNGNGIPDECEAPPANDIVWDPATNPTPWPNNNPLATTRSLAFSVTGPPGPSKEDAIKVCMVDLQNPVPPNAVQFPPQNFSAYETATCTASGEQNGCCRWVGPWVTVYESQGPPLAGPSIAARLQCTPYYWDWKSKGPIWVVGAEIMPSSQYSVQAYAASCMGSEATCTSVSTPVTMYTRRSGDVEAVYNPPTNVPQPDAIDLAQVVNKFKSVVGAPVKGRAQLQPNVPELNADINALDVVEVVNAIKGLAYPFAGPCPCPSLMTCRAVPCATPAVCVALPAANGGGPGAMCVKTCVGGTNDGQPCINIAHCPGGTSCGNPLPAQPGFCRDKCGRCTPP